MCLSFVGRQRVLGGVARNQALAAVSHHRSWQDAVDLHTVGDTALGEGFSK